MQEHSAMFDLTVKWKDFQRGVFERRKTSKGVEWVENVRIQHLLKIETPHANDDRALHTKCIGFSVVDWLLRSSFLALLELDGIMRFRHRRCGRLVHLTSDETRVVDLERAMALEGRNMSMTVPPTRANLAMPCSIGIQRLRRYIHASRVPMLATLSPTQGERFETVVWGSVSDRKGRPFRFDWRFPFRWNPKCPLGWEGEEPRASTRSLENLAIGPRTNAKWRRIWKRIRCCGTCSGWKRGPGECKTVRGRNCNSATWRNRTSWTWL